MEVRERREGDREFGEGRLEEGDVKRREDEEAVIAAIDDR